MPLVILRGKGATAGNRLASLDGYGDTLLENTFPLLELMLFIYKHLL